MQIKRIAIIGNAGSGKSVLAQRIATHLKLPLYHLDQYFWLPNWTHPDLDAYQKIHDQLCDKDAWVIDGMNLRLLPYRINRAQVIIFLDTPRYLCFWRIFKRMITYYGRETPSSAKGCREQISGEFVRFLKWVWDFKKRYSSKIREQLAQTDSSKKVFIFQSTKEIEAWFANVDKITNHS